MMRPRRFLFGRFLRASRFRAKKRLSDAIDPGGVPSEAGGEPSVISDQVKGFCFKLWYSNKEDEDAGEDAPPLLNVTPQNGYAGVFDGMGGSGGTVYKVEGVPRTGAFLAARLASQEFATRFSLFENPLTALSDTNELMLQLQQAFREKASRLDSGEPRLAGRLMRRLPTTIAVLAYERNAASIRSRTVWAGDSRAYLLTPQHGLQQISSDDLRSHGDALDNLRQDSPMSNFVSADLPFSLRRQDHDFNLPTVLLVATDGCFAYLPTPAHFEFILLETAMRASDAADWSRRLEAELKKVAGDDFSLVLIAIGWPEFPALQADFSNRHCEVTTRYIEPLESQEPSLTAEEQDSLELSRKLWKDYKQNYYRLMPGTNAGGEFDAQG